jgi:CSLREA domain-containing protein
MLRTRVSIAALLCLSFASGAHAQANDNWANRTPITVLPFHTADAHVDSATPEQTDPAPPCGGATNTVWYSFTTGGSPAYLSVYVTGYSGSPLATVAVYSGTPGAFKLVNGACASFGNNPNNARLYGVRLEPNTAYSIEVGNALPTGPGQPLDLTIAAAPTYTVTKTADTADGVCNGDCSLREAISAANAAPGAVVVPAGVYTLTGADSEDLNASGDLDVRAGMGIYGAGVDATTIDANHIDRVLDLIGVDGIARTFMIGELTIANGTRPAPVMFSDQQPGGGLYANLFQYDFVGLEHVKFIGNAAHFGGGGASIRNARGLVRECRFTGNSSTLTRGGGLSFNANPGYYLDVIGSTFDNNTAAEYGGGIEAGGGLRLVNSTVSGNHAVFGGAGVNASGNSPVLLRSNTIVFNDITAFSAPGAGLRIDTASGANEISNNVIAGNTSNPDDDNDCYNDGSALNTHHNHVQRNNNCTFAGTGRRARHRSPGRSGAGRQRGPDSDARARPPEPRGRHSRPDGLRRRFGRQAGVRPAWLFLSASLGHGVRQGRVREDVAHGVLR